MRQFKIYPIISGLFVAVLLISNILDVKIIDAFGLNLPAGILIFPLAYLFGDILTEVYGYAATRKIIWTGFFSLIMFIGLIKLAIALEPAPFWDGQESFEVTLGKLWRIIVASIIAYLVGEFANSYTVAKLKVRFKGEKLSFRLIFSTFVGQFFDTGIFIAIAYIGLYEASQLLEFFLIGWLFKVLWEVVLLPISLFVVKKMKEIEGIDFYDTDTEFNPLKL